MTLFSIATAAMILLASIYASYMLQTEEDINASSIQLAEDRDYSYALLVSSQYACIHAIDSFLQSNNNFSLSSDIKSNMTSSCFFIRCNCKNQVCQRRYLQLSIWRYYKAEISFDSQLKSCNYKSEQFNRVKLSIYN